MILPAFIVCFHLVEQSRDLDKTFGKYKIAPASQQPDTTKFLIIVTFIGIIFCSYYGLCSVLSALHAITCVRLLHNVKCYELQNFNLVPN